MELGSVLLLALLPGLGNLIGGLLALWSRPTRRFVGVALHAAAGIALAVISLELMPRAIEDGETPALIAAVLGGALASILIAEWVGRWRGGSAGAMMVVVATAVDLATDGLMTGAGSSVASGLGLLLAASQVVGNIPNGFAALANLGDKAARGQRIAILLGLPSIAVAAAGLGFVALRAAAPSLQAAALAFMTGVLLLSTIEDTVSQGDEPEPPRRYSSLAFAGGFALMMAMSELVGT